MPPSLKQMIALWGEGFAVRNPYGIIPFSIQREPTRLWVQNHLKSQEEKLRVST